MVTRRIFQSLSTLVIVALTKDRPTVAVSNKDSLNFRARRILVQGYCKPSRHLHYSQVRLFVLHCWQPNVLRLLI